jgi:acyl-homoserine-lactone acylase
MSTTTRHGRHRWGALAVTGALAATLVAPVEVAAQESGADATVVAAETGTYEAEIRRTSYGIPHVKADDLGSVAFGGAFAFAEDNLCVFAEEMVTIRGERSITFGDTAANRSSDLFHKRIIDAGRVEALLAGDQAPSAETREAVRGYAAGYSHFVTEVAPEEHADPNCAGADWIRPIDELDLWRFYHVLLMRAGEAAVADAIVAAQPPAASASAASEGVDVDDLDVDALGDALEEHLGDGGPIGSNAYGLGSEATVSGGGMVLGNPHFPWHGTQRFYRQHLTIPGELDVSGASLFGVPIVNIGHNADVAWSHTVSTADRFTLHLLQLVPGEPTRYLVDGVEREMTSTDVTIEVPDGDGGTETVTQTFWESHLGPVINLPPLTWNQNTALVIADANAGQARAFDTWLGMNRATSVDDLVDVLDATQGIPWVNTIAADSQGRALYADHSVVPHLTDEQRAACQLVAVSGFSILQGARGDCEPGSDPDAVAEGIFGPSNLPVLVRDDYVANMNNSYWLANPHAPLEGYDRIIGSERTNIGLRARLGLQMIEDRLAGTDGLDGQGFTLEQLQELMFNNRNLGAELVRDDLVAACRDAGETVTVGGIVVDLAEACDVLAAWDLRVDLDSRGAHVFREFARFGGLRFADEFDPDRPLTTPTVLDVEDERVLEALGQAVNRIEGAGIALDARLGFLQSVTRSGERIEIHGGPGGEGIFNVITAAWRGAEGYPEVQHGSSFVMAAEMTPEGPRSRAILTYSQSTDPSSPHYADQTRLYEDKGWTDMLFDEADILADPELTVRTVSAPRSTAPAPSFRDVAPGDVHARAILALAADGILVGYTDGTFRPQRSITRAQVASVVGAAFDIPPADSGPFVDVSPENPHYGRINGLAAAELIYGLTADTYGPSRPITRGQLASVLARTLGLERLDDGPFSDLGGSVHAGAINALAAAGIVSGYADGTFRPDQPISRAQTASLVDHAR